MPGRLLAAGSLHAAADRIGVDLVAFQQMGFGVAVALFLDATVIRSVLVPASMKVLARWNWYLPRWLEWLPNVHVEGPERKHGSAQTAS